MNKIGIIGAMETEVSLLKEKMKEYGEVARTEAGSLVFFEGKIAAKTVVVVKSGVGKVNAALCAQRLIFQFGVDAVINSGIAGAMGGNLGIFDMVASSDAVYHDMEAVAFGYKPTEIPQMKCSAFPSDKKLVAAALKAFENVNGVVSENANTVTADSVTADSGRKILVGRVATGDQFIADKNTKDRIREICSPLCCEMEGAAVAHACYLNGIPFLILRCISDMADDSVQATYSFNEDEAARESSALVLEMLEIID